jgi:hypothetical protein
MKNEQKDKWEIEVLKLDVAESVPFDKLVKVVDMGRIKEVVSVRTLNSDLGGRFLKKDKYGCVDRKTGEVVKYDIKENRGQNVAGVKRSLRNASYLINMNFTGARDERFLTLTYEENMTCPKRLYEDFEVFMKRLKRRHGKVEYISVVQPQGRGAWHIHCLVKFVSRRLFLFRVNNYQIGLMWGHGGTSTELIRDENRIGLYFLEDRGFWGSYPFGMRIIRCSRGINRPLVTKMYYGDFKKKVGLVRPSYAETREVLGVKGYGGKVSLNKITTERYDLRGR